MTEDVELLRRYVTSRSEEAFAELVRRHVDLVYSVALRQVGNDAHLAQDVAQTVFTALARKARELSQRAVIGGWLYRSTQFAASDAVRAERRRRAREQEVQSMHESSTAPSTDPAWDKLRPLLDEAIGELGETDRDAVWLRYFESRSFADIGLRLCLTENAARMRVERALDKLHALLARRGVASTTAALAIALAGQSGIAAPAGIAAALARSAVAGTTAAAGAAATGWTLFHIMNATKITVGLAAVVSAAALGTALYQSRELRESRAALAAAQETQDAMQGRIGDLEQEVAGYARKEVATKLPVVANVAAPNNNLPANVAEAPLTQESVKARYEHAQALDRDGRLAEALAEYLWCYDVGMPRIPALGGVRGSYLLGFIARLGERHPAALNALNARRDAAERRVLASADDFEAASTLTYINRALKDEPRSLEFHDRLPVGDPRREAIGKLLFEPLTAAQRYQEAAQAKPYHSMSGHFEMVAGREPKGATPALTEQLKQNQRNYVIRSAAKDIEVLVGVGDLEHAADLAMRVLAFDSSPETTALLESHVARAGRPGLLAALRKN